MHIISKPVFLTMIGDWENGELGLAIQSGRQSEFRESLEKSIEYATALGCNMQVNQN